jgi:hypothetical protein
MTFDGEEKDLNLRLVFCRALKYVWKNSLVLYLRNCAAFIHKYKTLKWDPLSWFPSRQFRQIIFSETVYVRFKTSEEGNYISLSAMAQKNKGATKSAETASFLISKALLTKATGNILARKAQLVANPTFRGRFRSPLSPSLRAMHQDEQKSAETASFLISKALLTKATENILACKVRLAANPTFRERSRSPLSQSLRTMHKDEQKRAEAASFLVSKALLTKATGNILACKVRLTANPTFRRRSRSPLAQSLRTMHKDEQTASFLVSKAPLAKAPVNILVYKSRPAVNPKFCGKSKSLLSPPLRTMHQDEQKSAEAASFRVIKAPLAKAPVNILVYKSRLAANPKFCGRSRSPLSPPLRTMDQDEKKIAKAASFLVSKAPLAKAPVNILVYKSRPAVNPKFCGKFKSPLSPPLRTMHQDEQKSAEAASFRVIKAPLAKAPVNILVYKSRPAANPKFC